MTKEEKRIHRTEHSKIRRSKRFDELKQIWSTMRIHHISFAKARNKVRGKSWKDWECEMGYGSCEDRGYCNEDC